MTVVKAKVESFYMKGLIFLLSVFVYCFVSSKLVTFWDLGFTNTKRTLCKFLIREIVCSMYKYTIILVLFFVKRISLQDKNINSML